MILEATLKENNSLPIPTTFTLGKKLFTLSVAPLCDGRQIPGTSVSEWSFVEMYSFHLITPELWMSGNFFFLVSVHHKNMSI